MFLFPRKPNGLRARFWLFFGVISLLPSTDTRNFALPDEVLHSVVKRSSATPPRHEDARADSSKAEVVKEAAGS